MKNKSIKTFFVAAAFLCSSLYAEVKLSVNSNQITAGDTVEFTISADGEKDIKIPDITKIENYSVSTIGSGSSSSGGTILGHKNSHKIASRTFTFTPEVDIVIPSYDVVVDGKTYKTQPATIKVLANKKYQQYDNLFDSINKKRYGLTNQTINRTKNPFIVTKKAVDINLSDANSTEALTPRYSLQAIINYKAKINGSWYRINDNINEYKLKRIKSRSVILDNAGSELELNLDKGRKNVKITFN